MCKRQGFARGRFEIQHVQRILGTADRRGEFLRRRSVERALGQEAQKLPMARLIALAERS